MGVASGNFLDTPLVREHSIDLRRALDARVQDGSLIRRCFDGRKLESPIESVFLMVWRFSEIVDAPHPCSQHVQLLEQQPVFAGGEHFRVDFLVWPQDPLVAMLSVNYGVSMRLAIEVDGHDFHERTKEQVAHRNHRDRVLQQHGWTVLHFAGSEVHGKPYECVRTTREAARPQMERIQKAILDGVNPSDLDNARRL